MRSIVEGLILNCLLLSSLCLAQEPGIVVEAPKSVPLGQPALIKLQTSADPTSIKILAFQHLEGKDRVVEGAVYELKEPLSYLFSWPQAGTYSLVVLGYHKDTNQVLFASVDIALGQGVIPEPTPPVPPDIKIGKRYVVIVHETANASPKLSQLFVSLRSGDVNKYMLEKGHKLYILDQDLEIARQWRDFLASRNQALPAIVIGDLALESGGGVLYAGPLPDTVDKVMELLKQYGG
ncbi:MAG: hypothetical protein KatS3mg087_1194 [Patescibacteria group bacterium]|nr:MAG: hypothetical protein KatS3mg087_1194 [Patescibacteria group bacterium]